MKQYNGEDRVWQWLETVFVNTEDRKKNFRYFARLKQQPQNRENQTNHEKLEVCDHYSGQLITWILDVLEAIKIKILNKLGSLQATLVQNTAPSTDLLTW